MNHALLICNQIETLSESLDGTEKILVGICNGEYVHCAEVRELVQQTGRVIAAVAALAAQSSRLQLAHSEAARALGITKDPS